jgi:hypothetical protein
MKNTTVLIILLFSIHRIFAQIPIEHYKTEIRNLKNQVEIEQYWGKLLDIDQNILVNTADVLIADSISIDLMIRTSLLFQIHGDNCYNKFNNALPFLNLSHSNVGNCQVFYWPIIEKCAQIGGVIESMGGKYPAYELESVSLTFFNYSLLNQDEKYNFLLSRLNGQVNDSIVEYLTEQFYQLKKMQTLKVKKVLNSWYNQPFTNLKEESIFEFVQMSDDQIYLKRFDRIERLIEMSSENGIRFFRIENEPFGWTFRYGNDGSLILLDEKNMILLNYSKITNANSK